MTEALFEPDGGRLVPTDVARGPWDPRALHGGPTGALLARAIEGAPADGGPFEVSRLTIELLRPVPVEPLAVEAQVIRPGRKVQLVEAAIRHAASGTEVARARALRIRSAPVPLPEDPMLRLDPPPPGPASSRREVSRFADDYVAYHNHGVEHRFAAGSWAEAGPVTDWIRLLVPVVAGEEPSPLQRVAAAADFANGVSRVLPWETHTFINPDLTIHLLRPAVGPWVCIDARSMIAGDGIGMAESALFDERGRIGRSVQSVIVETR